MREEEMRHIIKVKDIFNILSKEIAYRGLMDTVIGYLTGSGIKEEELDAVLGTFNKMKFIIAEAKRNRLGNWISNKNNLGLTEGLVFNEGVTNSEEIEGKAGKYILIWYSEINEDTVIIAKHLNSKEEVRSQILVDIDEFGPSIVRDLYVIDVENLKGVSFVVTIGEDTGCLEVKYLV